MNILDELFDALYFPVEQKEEVRAELDLIIKRAVITNLIERISKEQGFEIKDLSSNQNQVAQLTKQFITKEMFEAEQEKTIGEVLLVFIGSLLNDISEHQKLLINNVFKKYQLENLIVN